MRGSRAYKDSKQPWKRRNDIIEIQKVIGKKKEQADLQLKQANLQVKQGYLELAHQKRQDGLMEFGRRMDDIQKRYNETRDTKARLELVKEAKAAKDQALSVQREAITAASFITDPDEKKKFMDQTARDYKEAEGRYHQLNKTYRNHRDQNGPNGGEVVSREVVGEPKITDQAAALADAQRAIDEGGYDPRAVARKFKEAGGDPSKLRMPAGVDAVGAGL